MPFGGEWYREQVTQVVSKDPLLRRGRENLQDRPSQTALTMARELEVAYALTEADQFPFPSLIGLMQVTAFAVGLAVWQKGGERASFPLPTEQVNDLCDVFESMSRNAGFTPIGDPIKDMGRVKFVIASQVDTMNPGGYGFDEYREGVGLGLARWSELIAS